MWAPPTPSPASCLLQLRTTCLEMKSPYSGKHPIVPINSQDNPLQTYLQINLIQAIPQLRRFFQMTLGCVKFMFKLIRTHANTDTIPPNVSCLRLVGLIEGEPVYTEASYGGLCECSSPRAHTSNQHRWDLNPACQLQGPLFFHDHMLISHNHFTAHKHSLCLPSSDNSD